MKIDERDFLACEQAGMSAREIAERFKVSTRTIVRWRTRAHLNHAQPSKPHPPGERELARRLIEDGCSFKEAAATVGVSWRTIRRWFPDAHAWTPTQVGEHAALMTRIGRMAERTAA